MTSSPSPKPRMIPLRLALLVFALISLAELAAYVVVTGSRDVPVRGAHPARTWSREERATVDRYFAEHAVRKVQIGAGPNDFADWLNTDIEPRGSQVFLDATEKLPFPDHSVRYLYAEQVIEHVPYDAALSFFRECKRVLEPGGRIRLATPNLDQLLGLWSPDKSPIQQKFIDFQMAHNHLSNVPRPETALLNLMMHAWGHQFLYDPDSLKRTLRAAGLEPVDVKSGESTEADLRGIEHHYAVAGGKDIDDFTSQFVEATPAP